MEININKKSPTEASIKIRLNKSDYQPQVEKKVSEYARKADIKGFRAGKVPAGMIRKMYGKSILVEEINHIISHKLTDFIRENDLKILGEPLPDRESTSKIDWDTQEDFEFDYNIGMIDDFTLDLSKSQKVKKYVDAARAGEGPALLEISTYRFRGHSMSDPAKYRTKDEVETYKKMDPLRRAYDTLMESGVPEKDLARIESDVSHTLEQALDFAEKSEAPPPTDLYTDVYAP